MKSILAFSFVPALLWWGPALCCRWSLSLPGFLTVPQSWDPPWEGGCNSGASLTSFFMELPGNSWPGAVVCFCYCGGGTGVVRRLGAETGCPCPKQRGGLGPGCCFCKPGWVAGTALSEQPSLACQLSL